MHRMIIRGVIPQYYDYRITKKGKKKVECEPNIVKKLDLDVKLKGLDHTTFPLIHPRPYWYVDEGIDISTIKKGTIFIKPEAPKYIMAISTRTFQIAELLLLLRSRNIRTDYLAGAGKRKYDPTAQVLICQVKKAGAGFNDTKFDTNYYVSDITKIKQPFGRIRIDGGTHFDIVDDNPTLERHFKERRKYYVSLGAAISEYA